MSYQAECNNCEETYLTDDPNEVIGKCPYCEEWIEATPAMNEDGRCSNCGDYARDCPC
jgi:hypothetical protein